MRNKHKLKYSESRYILNLEMAQAITKEQFDEHIELDDLIIDFVSSYYKLGDSYVVFNEQDGIFHLFN